MSKNKDANGNRDRPKPITLATSQVSSPAITIDLVKYVHHLDGLDLTDEQALELLQTLSDIAWSFIALGYNVHPVQQAQKACGKDAVTAERQAFSSENDVSLLGQFIEENLAEYTDPETDRIRERTE